VIAITCWRSLYQPRAGIRASWPALLARVRSPRTYRRKVDVPRWSPARFVDGARRRGNVIDVGALVLDFDVAASRAQMDEAFGHLTGFAHSTWSSTLGRLRWRMCAVLSRPVGLDEFERVWRYGAIRAEGCGLTPDYAARDASRAWALPARGPGDVYEYLELFGAPVDVESALAAIPKPEPRAAANLAPLATSGRRLERASKYLAAMPAALAGSGGHTATFQAAVALVRGFALRPDDALRLLAGEYNPRCRPAWSIRELRHKVKSAFTGSRRPFGYLTGTSEAK